MEDAVFDVRRAYREAERGREPSEMGDREQDVQFARRVCGWTEVRKSAVCGYIGRPSAGGSNGAHVPRYSTDASLIPVMMAAVEKLAGGPVRLELDTDQAGGEKWECAAGPEPIYELGATANAALLAAGLAVADAVEVNHG